MAKDSVAVSIIGHEYKIRSDGDPESVRELAGYVDRAMAGVRDRTGMVDTADIAVLTCLNLAREILAQRGNRAPTGSTIVDDAKLRELIERVETSVGGASLAGAKTDESGAASAKAKKSTQAEKSAGDGKVSETPRTLDLPSVEALRDRAAARGEGAEEGEDALPEARVAAGGRDRAS